MKTFLREQSLSLIFFGLFVVSLCGQAIAGWHDYNNLESWHAQMAGETPETIGFLRYVTTSSFAQAVTENWQSEYLQFTLFILLTVWLLQKGSPELKPLHEAGRESDSDQQIGRHAGADAPRWGRVEGLRRVIFENSLLILRG